MDTQEVVIAVPSEALTFTRFGWDFNGHLGLPPGCRALQCRDRDEFTLKIVASSNALEEVRRCVDASFDEMRLENEKRFREQQEVVDRFKAGSLVPASELEKKATRATDCRSCNACFQELPVSCFSKAQKKNGDKRRCFTCVETGRSGVPKELTVEVGYVMFGDHYEVPEPLKWRLAKLPILAALTQSSITVRRQSDMEHDCHYTYFAAVGGPDRHSNESIGKLIERLIRDSATAQSRAACTWLPSDDVHRG